MNPQAYIIIQYKGDTLLGYLLSRRETPLTDYDCVEHFPPETSGKEIKELAVELGIATSPNNVQWRAKPQTFE